MCNNTVVFIATQYQIAKMAGVVGFEPTNLYKKIACLVGRCYQPLNQTPINAVFLIYVKNSLKNTFYGVIKILAIMPIFNNQNLLDFG